MNDGIVFYPQMGIDIIAPLMGIDNVSKIYTLGPVETRKFKKGAVEKTMNYIHKLMEYGDNRFDVDDPDDVVEFFEDIGTKMKSYNFKRKKMWMSQYRTCDEKLVSLYYYYDSRINDPKLPFNIKLDYIVHKGFEFTDHLKKLVKPLLKPSTRLIAPEEELLADWNVPESVLDESKPVDTYDITLDRDQFLYNLNINDYF
jgi:hypothetical protein